MQPNQYPQGYQPQQGHQPQQYAPQQNAPGYGQPAPQQGYAPQAQYTGPPQGYAPQQAPQAAPGYGGPNPNPDEFGNPDAVGGVRPRLKDAGPGRLVLITPIKIERGIPNRLAKPDQNGQLPVQDRMTADVVWLDGPPFLYGGDPDGDGGPPKPHNTQANIPHEARNMWITNTLLISQCERSLPTTPNASGTPVLGRLVKGVSSRPGNRPPWKLDDPTEGDRQAARDYLRAKQEGRITGPSPVAGQPQQAQQHAPAPQAQPQYAPQGAYVGGGGAGGYAGPAMAYGNNGPGVAYGGNGAPAQQYLGDPNAGAQYAPQGQPPAPPAYGGIPQGQAPGEPQAAPGAQQWAGPPAAALDTNAVPPGWTPEVWANVPEEQRQMVVAANAARPGI